MMVKNMLMKVSLCLGATLIMGSHVDATTVDINSGIAGFSYIMDQYYMLSDNSVLAHPEEIEERVSEEAPEKKDELSEEEKKEKVVKVKNIKPKSEYANLGIATNVIDYVNVRKSASTDSEIVGKLFKGCAADIIKIKDGWAKVKSGNVTGYISTDYLAIGEDAEKLVDKYGTKIATVTTQTLKVREKKSVDSACLTLIPGGEEYVVLEDNKEWAKVVIDDDNGYVSKEYIDISYEFEHAISVEEEQAKKEAEEAAKRAEAERLAALAAENNANNSSRPSRPSKPSKPSVGSSNSSSSSSSSSSSKGGSSSGTTSSATGSGTGANIANYALKFVGNPYVYGGTSLTGGTDCSGFVQSVYRHYGYSLPRTSGQQAGAGVAVSGGNLQAGDLIYYASNGRVNHIAIYIGNGKVVHASNPRSGIKVSVYNYRTPAGYRRVAR